MRLTTKQAAEYLGISYYYLRNMRHLLHKHEGPKFYYGYHPRGRACYYSAIDLDEWKKSHKGRLLLFKQNQNTSERSHQDSNKA